MWKFLEDIKNDVKKGLEEVADENVSKEIQSKTEEEALTNGRKAIRGNSIVALQDGTVEMINQDQDQVEIYFDNGTGYGIKFPYGPTAFSVKVSANEKVRAGQTLVTFGPNLDSGAQVYAFTPDMIKILTESRFRIR